ncbi:MAG: alkylhydroperoxidase like protein AhpD family [Jatrophihabitantaceae bacterium]|nr:alkylhydroperoxidase like protein AhpD family [Jatrophihabitantaceae bacterium]
MDARMTSPAMILPHALPALLALNGAIAAVGVDPVLLELVNLRVSQINGCGYCIDMHARDLRQANQSDERLFGVSAWRETPYFTDTERAALALAESATRLSDRAEAVPDDVWDDAADHFNEPQLAALIMAIGMINLWNRLNVTTRQVAGTGWSARSA